MADQFHPKHKVQLDRFTVMAPSSPFVDVILYSSQVDERDFKRIADLAESYPNDPRMIEVVRKAGDASAKVPYLMDSGETPKSILEALREVAAPHVASLKKLPSPLQATIHTLLSLSLVPTGYDEYGIPALLEINRMQKEMAQVLHGMMAGRKMAQEFHEENHKALKLLDGEWQDLRSKGRAPWPLMQSLPEQSQMQYVPIFYMKSVVGVREMCVIVDSPAAAELRNLTPPILQNPLPEDVEVPVTGSADWLLRKVGKIGRHFTRALLDIITQHLQAERIHLQARDYDRINYEAFDALRSFNERNP